MRFQILAVAFFVLLLPQPVHGFAAGINKNNRSDRKLAKLVDRMQQQERNPKPAPGAKHSTERLEEPGRHRNYGTEYTNDKRSQQHQQKDDDTEKGNSSGGRAWAFGKVPWW